jgi:hypothetical protein
VDGYLDRIGFFVPKGTIGLSLGFQPQVGIKRGPALKVAVEKRFPSWMSNEILNEFLPPLQHRQPATRVQFRLGAVLQAFAKPTPLFEHEDEHEYDFEAPGEGGALLSICPGVETPGLSPGPFGTEIDLNTVRKIEATPRCCLEKRRVNPIGSAFPELHPRSGVEGSDIGLESSLASLCLNRQPRTKMVRLGLLAGA